MYTFIMIQIVVNQASPTSFSSSYPWTSKRGKKRVGEKLKLGNTSSYKYHSTYSVYNANLLRIGFILNHVCTSAGRALLLTSVCVIGSAPWNVHWVMVSLCQCSVITQQGAPKVMELLVWNGLRIGKQAWLFGGLQFFCWYGKRF